MSMSICWNLFQDLQLKMFHQKKKQHQQQQQQQKKKKKNDGTSLGDAVLLGSMFKFWQDAVVTSPDRAPLPLENFKIIWPVRSCARL